MSDKEFKPPTIEELIEAVKLAYQCTSRCPSRGVEGGLSTHYASASGALRLNAKCISRNSPIENMPPDWLRGFDSGFEFSDGDERLDDYVDGLRAGRAVADAVFNWRDRKSTIPLNVPPSDWNETEKNMFFMRRDWHEVMDHMSELHARIDELTDERTVDFRARKAAKTPGGQPMNDTAINGATYGS